MQGASILNDLPYEARDDYDVQALIRLSKG